MKTETIIRSAYTEIASHLSVRYELRESDTDGRQAYSFAVSLAETKESAVVHDVTSDRDKAIFMFDMICRGSVTPCCLAEVTEDLIETADELIREYGEHRQPSLL